MCQFLSVISDGKGKTEFFKVEDIAKQMSTGNKKNYDWNSHTSIAHFIGLTPLQEDKWNKWEYNPEKKELKVDNLVTADDSVEVKKAIEKYLKDKDIGYLRNLYNRNSGDYNSGNRNSGYYNSGDYNSGNRNSGNCNSGYRNSGDCNSGDCNSGNRNSGDCNSKSIIGHFSSKEQYFLFNEKCTKKEANEVYNLDLYLNLTKWISESDMTEEEKQNNPSYKTTGGYLKTIPYKEAWKEVPKEVIDKIKKLKNFNKKVFFEITGLK